MRQQQMTHPFLFKFRPIYDGLPFAVVKLSSICFTFAAKILQ